jgi:hypothetical protein
MTNYYRQEDQFPDDAETAVDLANSAAAPLATAGDDAQAALKQIEVQLGMLYEDAEERHDERGLVAVSATWQHSQALAAQVVHEDAAIKAFQVAVAKVTEKRNAIAGELEELTEAV